MKVVITAEIPDNVPVLSNTVHTMLRDALAEFCNRREPEWEYVRLRYPQGYLGDHANDARKIAEVKNRLILARALQQNTIRLVETMSPHELYDLVATDGPTRVMLDAHTAAPLRAARAQLDEHVPYDVVFVRDDNWMLGTKVEFEAEAYETWKEMWVGEVRRFVADGTVTWIPKVYDRAAQR